MKFIERKIKQVKLGKKYMTDKLNKRKNIGLVQIKKRSDISKRKLWHVFNGKVKKNM